MIRYSTQSIDCLKTVSLRQILFSVWPVMLLLIISSLYCLCRLIQIVSDQALEINVRTEAVIVLGSVANGTEDDARATVESGIVIALLRGKSMLVLILNPLNW
jgi:hypothetical protein